MKRKAISKKTRFEVFKRDSFKCQYCGASAPTVSLRCDHIEPHSKGGSDDVSNLITSCFDCNSGKGATRIADDAAIKKSKASIDEIQNRRETLKAMVQWKSELVSVSFQEIESICSLFETLFGFSVNDIGRTKIKFWLRHNSAEDILSAVKDAFDRHDPADSCLEKSESIFFSIPKIIATKKAYAKDPQLKQIHYVRAILRNRHGLTSNEKWQIVDVIRSLLDVVGFDETKKLAAHSGSVRKFERNALSIVNPPTDCA